MCMIMDLPIRIPFVKGYNKRGSCSYIQTQELAIVSFFAQTVVVNFYILKDLTLFQTPSDPHSHRNFV